MPVCPEQLGGLPTPREPAEIQRSGKVLTKSGKNITKRLLKGAKETLKITKIVGVKEVILKSRSPSCGSGLIYDGSFLRRLIKGDGITAALLKKNKIRIITEEKLR